MTDPLTKAVRAALAASPLSIRDLARRAGISKSHLARFASGERRVTPEAAEAVLSALEAVGAECAAQAARVRRALTTYREAR